MLKAEHSQKQIDEKKLEQTFAILTSAKSRKYAAVRFNTAQHNPKGIVQHRNRLLTIKRIFAKEKKQTSNVVKPTVLHTRLGGKKKTKH